MKVLLHICCGPCSIYPIIKLTGLKIAFEMYFYNPYIYPKEELDRRIEGARRVAIRFKAKVFINDQTLYDEKRARDCSGCYLVRLDEVFIYAKNNGYTHVSSSLLGSPFQKTELIINHMSELAQKYGLLLYTPDFKEGFYYGQKLAKSNEIYCQKYCGCYQSYLAMAKEFKEAK